MPKKTLTTQAAKNSAASVANAASAPISDAEPLARPAGRKAAAPVSKPETKASKPAKAKSNAPASSAASAKPKATASKPKATAATVKATPTVVPAPAISSDDIALRAYYLGEKRLRLGLPGDSAHDWLEAERQLVAEAKLASKSAKSR